MIKETREVREKFKIPRWLACDEPSSINLLTGLLVVLG